jgi:CTP synthase (UTP-ammonia lyase)
LADIINNWIKIGLIGSYEPTRPSHPATEVALGHAADGLGLELETVWLPSRELKKEAGSVGFLGSFQGLFAAPGKTYTSLSGALPRSGFAGKDPAPFWAPEVGSNILWRSMP